jgi:hypothetical protein
VVSPGISCQLALAGATVVSVNRPIAKASFFMVIYLGCVVEDDEPVNRPDLSYSASSSLWPRVRVLLFCVRVLLLCAKHLFVAAMDGKGPDH